MKRGAVDVLVTAPINKHNIQNEQFHFPGHTEYLEQCFGGLGKKALMILIKDNLRVALVTGHIPLAQVASKITVEDIVSKLRIFNQSLRQDFGIVRPRIAVLALNPHAGDAGLLGKEGQNARLAARLTGYKIDIKSETQAKEMGLFEQMGLQYGDAPEETEEVSQDDYQEENNEQ